MMCKEGHFFNQMPSNRLRGQGCPYCKGFYRTKEEVIELFNRVHNYKYDYSEFNFVNMKTVGAIICPSHGRFYKCFSNHYNDKKRLP